MPDTVTATESLEGKRVVSSDGEAFGVVAGVRSGTMYVDLDPDLDDRLLARLGWDGVDQEDYPLGADTIDRVSNGEIYLDAL